MTSANGSDPTTAHCGGQHCLTCGDDGEPMIVVKVDEGLGLALCATQDGARATVETALVEPVAPGEHVLVHAGTAIARLYASDGEVAA